MIDITYLKLSPFINFIAIIMVFYHATTYKGENTGGLGSLILFTNIFFSFVLALIKL